jgi:4'-phosphopantetheinyl transferase
MTRDEPSLMTDLASVYWLTCTGDEVPGGGEWLTERERDKLKELRFIKRRADWRLGRWTAKRAVCAWMLRDGRAARPADVEIAAAADGAPDARVFGGKGECTVSISHCRGVGFVALTPGRTGLGCDVEAVEERGERFVRDYFTELEVAAVGGVPEPDRPVVGTLIWSAKESALKAARVGLGRDTRSMEVRLESGTAFADRSWMPLAIKCLETGWVYRGWWMLSDRMLFTISCRLESEQPFRLDDQGVPR